MEITKEVFNSSVVLNISGRLDISNQETFEAEIENAFQDDFSKLIIDCLNLSFISSAGLRVFMKALKLSTSSNRKLVISSLTPVTKKIFEITGYDNIFEIAGTKEEALNNY